MVIQWLCSNTLHSPCFKVYDTGKKIFHDLVGMSHSKVFKRKKPKLQTLSIEEIGF